MPGPAAGLMSCMDCAGLLSPFDVYLSNHLLLVFFFLLKFVFLCLQSMLNIPVQTEVSRLRLLSAACACFSTGLLWLNPSQSLARLYFCSLRVR